jgi:hypothetical protein
MPRGRTRGAWWRLWRTGTAQDPRPLLAHLDSWEVEDKDGWTVFVFSLLTVGPT